MFSRNYQKTFNVVKNFLISWKSNAAAQKKKFSIKYFFSECDQMALTLHDFTENFYVIWFVNCKTIGINLCRESSIMADLSDKYFAE